MGFELKLLPMSSVEAVASPRWPSLSLEGKEGVRAGSKAAARRKSAGRLQKACGKVSPPTPSPPRRGCS